MQNSCPKMNRRLSRVSTSILAAIFHHFNPAMLSYISIPPHYSAAACYSAIYQTRSSSSSSGNIIYDGDNHCRSLAATLQIYIAVSSVDFWLLSATGIFDNNPVFKATSKQKSDFFECQIGKRIRLGTFQLVMSRAVKVPSRTEPSWGTLIFELKTS